MSESYVQAVIHEFRRLKSLGDGAISQVSPEQFFACPTAGDNSIAIIVKHVGGNLVSRWTDFLTSDGEKPGRNRDMEFEIATNESREQLLQMWERGWMTISINLIIDSDRSLRCDWCNASSRSGRRVVGGVAAVLAGRS